MTFMRGHMDKRHASGIAVGRPRPITIVWKASAVVDDDSKVFANELEQLLNARSAEGFTLANIIQRPADNGLVLVHQKCVEGERPSEEGSEPSPGAN